MVWIHPSRALALVSLVTLGMLLAATPGPQVTHAQATAPAPAIPPLGSAAASDAEPMAAEPPGYRQAVDDALREYEIGNYAEARSLFRRAHGLLPSARTHRGLGKAEFELRNYPSSVTHLEAALASPVRRLEGEMRADTEQLLGRARSFVGRLRLETRPTAAALLVDGIPAAVAPGEALVLSVGDHFIEASAPGYAAEKRRVSITGGEEEVLTILFARPSDDAEARSREKRWLRSPWLWSAVGVVVAGAAVGAVLATRGGDKVDAPYGGSAGAVLIGPKKDAP